MFILIIRSLLLGTRWNSSRVAKTDNKLERVLFNNYFFFFFITFESTVPALECVYTTPAFDAVMLVASTLTFAERGVYE